MPKFDYIIQNPPYKGTLYIDFILCMHDKCEHMNVVCPATFILSQYRKFENSKTIHLKRTFYDKIIKNVKTIIYTDLNVKFKIASCFYFSYIYLDNTRTYDEHLVYQLGYNKFISEDIFSIGNKKLVHGILDKIKTSKYDMVNKHTINNVINQKNTVYARKLRMCCGMTCFNKGLSAYYNRGCLTNESKFSYNLTNAIIYDEIQPTQYYLIKKQSKTINDQQYCDVKHNLENFIYFVKNSKLTIFLCILLEGLSVQTEAYKYTPYVTDYVDDDTLFKTLKFSNEEIDLINFWSSYLCKKHMYKTFRGEYEV